MGDGLYHSFDLSTLLRLGDLDIRGISDDFMALTIREYFSLLSDFLEAAPKVSDALTKITVLGGDEADFKSLDDMKHLLRSMGYSKLTPVIDGVVDAGKKGSKEFAADCAKKLLNDFSRLYNRIIITVKPDRPRNQPYNPDEETFEKQTLKVVLKQLEHEEATRKLQVLAIDDSPVVLKSISSALSSNYTVYTLSEPMLVEKFLKEITPELFLLDYKMPRRSGFDLVPIIRNFEEHKDTPIIFLTSAGTSDNVSAAAMLGASDFMVKPFHGDTLREKVSRHIVKKKMF
ncbi:MAG: response regulator [Treponema sp.]|nr:response regulator [Treponema sp.]